MLFHYLFDKNCWVDKRFKTYPRLNEIWKAWLQNKSRLLGGSGLGFSLVKRVVEKQSGKITVIGAESVGTIVTVTFSVANKVYKLETS